MGAYGSMVVDTEPDSFQGVLTTLDTGLLQISSVKSTPAVCRTSTGRDRPRTDEAAFSLQLVHSGRCRITHAGVESHGMRGDMFLVDSNKTYELTFVEPIQGLVLLPPWSRFRVHAEKLEALAGQPLNVACGPGAVLSNFIRAAWDQLAEDVDEEWPHSATEVIWDLLEAVLRGERATLVATRRSARLRHEAATLVEEQFKDFAFLSSGMAAALGVSPRVLQLAFAEVGTTPSRFLLARRLDAVASRLTRLDEPQRITDAALECGFSDLSYFSRAFRRRFGISARAFRQGPDAVATPRTDWLHGPRQV
jgi:AraC-like DNA-binding protein